MRNFWNGEKRWSVNGRERANIFNFSSNLSNLEAASSFSHFNRCRATRLETLLTLALCNLYARSDSSISSALSDNDQILHDPIFEGLSNTGSPESFTAIGIVRQDGYNQGYGHQGVQNFLDA
jgi:hypothetical protein